jgi:hypothetical protein
MQEKNEVYEFEVVTRFRVVANNKHDALQGALGVEDSLNDASCQASYGGTATVIRCKPPTVRRFLKTKRAMPKEPVRREVADQINRRRSLLGALTFQWRVGLKKYGKDYSYVVAEPTKEQAIETARVKLYHDTSHTGASLQSIHQEDA